MSLRSVPKIAFCRYCGTMTMWYRQYHRTWLWFCHARIVVSPSCGLGGSTLGETTVLFTNQRRNGRAFSSLTARGGGLPIGVMTHFTRRTATSAGSVSAPRPAAPWLPAAAQSPRPGRCPAPAPRSRLRRAAARVSAPAARAASTSPRRRSASRRASSRRCCQVSMNGVRRARMTVPYPRLPGTGLMSFQTSTLTVSCASASTIRCFHPRGNGQKRLRLRTFPSHLRPGVSRIFLTAPLSYAAVGLPPGRGEKLLATENSQPVK